MQSQKRKIVTGAKFALQFRLPRGRASPAIDRSTGRRVKLTRFLDVAP